MAGKYETHITLSANDAVELDRLHAWSTARGLKWTHIVLDRGVETSQPMISYRLNGNIEVVRRRLDELTQEIHHAGGTIVRVKIEAEVANDEVPVSIDDGPVAEYRYFEHHVKVAVPNECDLRDLTLIATSHDARLSRNARRKREDGFQERFVTQRVYGSGKETAGERLNELLMAIRGSNYQIIEVEQEYVIFDSNIKLDSGWLDVKQGAFDV